MTFFDEQGNQISCDEWLKVYEPYYFLHGPAYGQHISGRNQTSPFVENQVCGLLQQTAQLSRKDLILAMAWKIGLIDHHRSEVVQKIEYLSDWPTALKDRYGRDFSGGISYLASRMSSIRPQIDQGNPHFLFDLHPTLASFGPVYVLNVLFFVSNGKYPIYDQFAHVAAKAIHQGLKPESYVAYNAIQEWTDYKDYMNLLSPISKACPEQFRHPSMFVSRPVDRALWVYGHFFRTKGGCAPTYIRRSTRSSAPSTPVPSGVLVGRIRDLCQTNSDGWRRREIIVRKEGGRPKERDLIRLIDASGGNHGEFPFIKGAGVQGYVCLGKPGALKLWFTRRYPIGEIKSENVYLEPTGASNEYRIYSESEWRVNKS